jgi:hypothetical protein
VEEESKSSTGFVFLLSKEASLVRVTVLKRSLAMITLVLVLPVNMEFQKHQN